MTTGLKLPLRATPRGGAETHDGASLRKQNIVLGILPASSLHPWGQSLTIPEDVIFRISDASVRDLIHGHVQKFFAEQERLKLTKLAKGPNGVKITSMKNGEVEIVINYIDLEDNTSRSVSFTAGKR